MSLPVFRSWSSADRRPQTAWRTMTTLSRSYLPTARSCIASGDDVCCAVHGKVNTDRCHENHDVSKLQVDKKLYQSCATITATTKKPLAIMDSKSCNNFISYVGFEEHEMQVNIVNVKHSLWKYVTFFFFFFYGNIFHCLGMCLQPLGASRRNSMNENSIKLLPGEVLIAEAQSVLMFSPVGDLKQGTSGVLSVTNFKLTFITSDDSNGEVRWLD